MKFLLSLNLLGEIVVIYCVFILLGPPFTKSDVVVFAAMSWFLGTFITENYYINRLPGVLINNMRLLKFLLIYYFVIFFYVRVFHQKGSENLDLIYFFLYLLVALIVWRTLVFILIKKAVKRSKNKRNIIIVGISDEGIHLKNFIDRKPQYGMKVTGFFSDALSDEISEAVNVIGSYDQVTRFCLENKVSEIICSIDKLNKDYLLNLIEFAENKLIDIRILPDSPNAIGRSFVTTFLENIPLLALREKPFDKAFNVFLKRTFDILFSLSVIVLILSWLFPIIALLILIDSKGPVIFSQYRTGLFNKDFKCYKFRTMVVNKDADTAQATKADPRVTKIGAFLRKTSLDELPQFFNVFLGNMSIVGPRPHMLKHTEHYSLIIDKYMRRHLVKPGITGLSQSMGYRGETEHDLHLMKMRVRMDRFYIENWSFYLDLKIVYATVLSMIKPKHEIY